MVLVTSSVVVGEEFFVKEGLTDFTVIKVRLKSVIEVVSVVS